MGQTLECHEHPNRTAEVAIVLSDEERETLERWARRPTSAALAPAEGTSNKDDDCHPVTVGKWRRRFAQCGSMGYRMSRAPGRPARSPMRWKR